MNSIKKNIFLFLIIFLSNIHVPTFILSCMKLRGCWRDKLAFSFMSSCKTFIVTLSIGLITFAVSVFVACIFFFLYISYKNFRRISFLIFSPYFIFMSDFIIYMFFYKFVSKKYFGLIMSFLVVNLMLNYYFVAIGYKNISVASKNAEQFTDSKTWSFILIFPYIRNILFQSSFSAFTLAFDEIVCYRIFKDMSTINCQYQYIISSEDKLMFILITFILTLGLNFAFIKVFNLIINLTYKHVLKKRISNTCLTLMLEENIENKKLYKNKS